MPIERLDRLKNKMTSCVLFRLVVTDRESTEFMCCQILTHSFMKSSVIYPCNPFPPPYLQPGPIPFHRSFEARPHSTPTLARPHWHSTTPFHSTHSPTLPFAARPHSTSPIRAFHSTHSPTLPFAARPHSTSPIRAFHSTHSPTLPFAARPHSISPIPVCNISGATGQFPSI